ncbi:MAG: chromosomal replication initiator protein DnaA [Candidatus Komeilibacteria bacterium]|nr:chromosomal replication initiator protein DnaA [Candidatus Komeilibacteria bacterium]
MHTNQLWETVLGELELSISKANFTTWFKNTFILSMDEDGVVVGVPNAFTKAWLENKYHQHIVDALGKSSRGNIKNVVYRVAALTEQPQTSERVVSVEVNNSNNPATSSPILASGARSDGSASSPYGLNPKYTFQSFIVGKGNDLATAAARAVVDRPGEVYNPLFLYGGVGLGKTHLLQAVGNAMLETNPKAKIIYINSERFVNDFINSIKKGTMDELKKYYRSADALLIDDIQFIAGKEQTQEEFFHTFNDLHQKNKQIVLTSDRPPKAIAEIEQRLISRFEWGMIADISLPNLETRYAILEAKCSERNIEIAPDIISFIAENVQNNIRELEGALNRIIAYKQLNNTSLTLDVVQGVLGSLSLSAKKSGLTPKKILTRVASFYDIAMDDLLGSSRRKELVVPRQIAMWLMREELKSSYPAIGQEFGGRDHTTAIHACNKIEDAAKTDGKMKSDIDLLRQQLYAS